MCQRPRNGSSSKLTAGAQLTAFGVEDDLPATVAVTTRERDIIERYLGAEIDASLTGGAGSAGAENSAVEA